MPIKNNGNPGEFDYEKYCYGKQISHLCFASPQQYIVLDSNIFTLKSFFARQQAKVLAIIHQHISNKNTIGIAEALLVGERSGIDNETWSTYSKAGISHIIAISGMHISLIFQAIVFIITLNHRKKNLRKPAIIMAMLGMWFFAALTGMPASISRAAVMFSFIAIAQLFDLQTKTYNVLALSAVCLLWINTQYLFDVGFQLSYAALLGILLFTKKLESYRPNNNFFVKNIWTLVSATLAAQVFTFPLCLYYFHQMPLLFIPANLVAIPATLLCLALEIGILIFHFIASPIADFLGTCTQVIIEWNNSFIAWMASIKAAQVTQVQLSSVQMLLLLATLALLSIAWYHKSKNSLLLGLSSLLLYATVGWQVKYQNTQRKEFVVLHIPKDSYGMLLQNGKSLPFLQSKDTAALQSRYIDATNTFYQAKLISNNPQQKETALTANNFIDSNFNCFTIGDAAYCQAFNKTYLRMPKVDYLLLSHNAKVDLSQLDSTHYPKTIIIDGSNSLWKISQWKTQASALPLRLHITAEQGAWHQKL
jgi:competence protein ComEC